MAHLLYISFKTKSNVPCFPSFLHLFLLGKHLFNAYYGPGSMVNSEKTKLNKNSVSRGSIILLSFTWTVPYHYSFLVLIFLTFFPLHPSCNLICISILRKTSQNPGGQRETEIYNYDFKRVGDVVCYIKEYISQDICCSVFVTDISAY